jgi:hypothetical protein
VLCVALSVTTACVIFEGAEHVVDSPPRGDDAGDADAPLGHDGATRPEAAPPTDAGADATRRKIVFVTGSSRNGALGGIDGGDAVCNAEAASSGLSGVFVAYLSRGGGGSGHPAGRLLGDAGWSRADGLVAFDGNPRNVAPSLPIDVTADAGRLPAGERVWTGIYNGPTSICGTGVDGPWTTVNPPLEGAGWGDPKAQDGAWHVHSTLTACSDRLHLYCFEQ